MKTTSILLVLVLVTGFVSAQEASILPAQREAILILSAQQGFTNQTLDSWLLGVYGTDLDHLSRVSAGNAIQRFQSSTPPVAPMPSQSRATAPQTSPLLTQPAQQPVNRPAVTKPKANTRQPITATVLEPGMSKRFHLIDGNIIFGTITRIEKGVCDVETPDGTLKVPTKDILEETAKITKKDDTRYVGPVLKDTSQEIVLRSKYGDVVVSKKDIKDMERYHGGRLVPWAEVKKTFYQGSEILTDLFMDPTAFPLEANTFYISGLSLGYGFTEKFMLRTKFGSAFSGDLNLQGHYRFYHRSTAQKESAAAIGVSIHRAYNMSTLLAKYSHFVTDNTTGALLSDQDNINAADVMLDPEETRLWSEFYYVMSYRKPLATGRGKVGTHFGFRTNNIRSIRDDILDPAKYSWDYDKFSYPYRIFAGFEYDLSKNLKFLAQAWADNGYKAMDFGDAWKDYFGDDTKLVFDEMKGTYNQFDFDFGFTYAVSETFRFGIHFQQPYLIFYWEFYEL